MEFMKIPKNRYIQLKESELLRLGYKLPSKVYFDFAEGINPCFKLTKLTEKRGEVSFGPVKITEDGCLQIPKELKLFTQYAVRYFDKSLQIFLAK